MRNKKSLIFKSLVVFSAFLTFSCKQNTSIPENFQADFQSSKAKKDYSKVKNTSDFISIAKKYNVNLSDSDLNEISMQTNLNINGEWLPLNGNTPEENLVNHFKKHNREFDPPFKNPLDYSMSAVRAINDISEDFEHYFDIKYKKEQNIISAPKWNSVTKEFIVIRSSGKIATYFIKKNLRSDRFIYIPKDLEQRSLKLKKVLQ